VLRITEKEDFDARKRQVEAVVATWRESVERIPAAVEQEFRSKLMISLIYHDSALEGEVLTHSEIKAATDTSIISDSSLIPSYEDITNFNASVSVALQLAGQKKRVPVGLELIKQLFGILDPAAKSSNYAYRKENPLHRLYYHDIAAPEEIAAGMKKLDKWLGSDEFSALEPIEQAAEAHWRLMAIFPWLQQSGRLSRILSLMILEQAGYPLPVIHSIDRQAYYEALRSSDRRPLIRLYLEAVETTASSALRVYEEVGAYRGRGARAS
jgi:Fic family protein